MRSPFNELIYKWRDCANELERELAVLERHIPPTRKLLLTKRDKDIIVQYVQGNAVCSTIRTCANELETELADYEGEPNG